MAPKIYCMDLSPPVRAVYLTAAALKIDLEHIEINLLENDHFKPNFLKMNPQHTIPTLDDNGTVIWDSHAINVYLVSKYGKDDTLYPKDYAKRAVIDQRMHFDSGLAFATARRIAEPIIFKGAKSVAPNLIEEANKVYEFLEKFLEGQEWTAGEKLTLADLCLVPSITSLDVLVPINKEKYPNIIAWIKRAQKLPYYNVNQEGLDKLDAHIKKLFSS